jgi:hypothetical protein
MIKHSTALKIATVWHGGQWSPLYSYASTGKLSTEDALLIIEEVIQNYIQHEIALKPYFLSKKDKSDLTNLKNYFISEYNKIGIDIRLCKDFYGFEMPYLYGTNLNVKGIRRLN